MTGFRISVHIWNRIVLPMPKNAVYSDSSQGFGIDSVFNTQKARSLFKVYCVFNTDSRQGYKYMSAQAQGLYWMRPCSVCLEGAALECGS